VGALAVPEPLADLGVSGNGAVAGSLGRERLAVTRLGLTDFRCYRDQRLEADARSVVLVGPNGAGKTNLLEALSFLAPGRGLRRARLAEVGRMEPGWAAETARPWAVAATLRLGGREIRIGTGREVDDGRDKRVVKIDGRTEKNQSALGAVFGAQWLTPDMDRIFQDGTGARRRFVDRLIYGLDPDHGGPVAAYAQSLRGRSRLLREGRADAAWLANIEDSMARHGVAVAARRRDALANLNRAASIAGGPFPEARLAMVGEVDDWLADEPALAVEDRLRRRLGESREVDARTGGAAVGPHRSDLVCRHGADGMPADRCSTGEQKALLISIVLAAAELQAERRGRAPLLLLDEVLAHLDAERRAALFARIAGLGAQAWMTGTEFDTFRPLGAEAQFFDVRNGVISPH
jgi:DNA replication and repair protein RecF